MVDQNRAYLFRKRGIYYFSKRIPSDTEVSIVLEHKLLALIKRYALNPLRKLGYISS